MTINLEELRPLTFYLEENTIKNPEKSSIVYDDLSISYSELNRMTSNFANYLLKEIKDKKIAIFLENTPEFVISYYSILKAGYTVCPVNPFFKGHELEYQLNDLSCTTLITTSERVGLLNQVIDNTAIENVILVGEDPPEDERDYKIVSYNNCINFESETQLINQVNINQKDDIALIMYTSGSSGNPKGAMLSYYNCSFKTACVVKNFSMNQDNVSAVMPIYHIAGMLVGLNSPIMSNGTIALFKHYDAKKLDAYIKDNKITFLYTTPVMNNDLLELNSSKVKSKLRINIGTSFGMKITEELSNKFEEIYGIPYYEFAYGMTEGHTGNTLMPVDHYKFNCHGKPTYHTSIKIVDDKFNELKNGELGQIILKSPSVFQGYLNDDEKTQSSFHDGYFITGDMGRLNEEGFLIYEGRFKELIKISGFSVFPEEVEGILNKNAGVKKCAVVGKPHPKKGEVAIAYVVLNNELTEQELIEWAKENMTYYKVPREIKFVDSLPETSAGKLLRRKLRQE